MPGLFDSQLYMFEAVGTLVNILFRTTEQQTALLLSVVKPLLDDLSLNMQTAAKGTQDVLPIIKVHHVIMALGNIAKGFPDYPSPVPEGWIGPPLEVFGQVAQAILMCLEAMNIFKVVRDAVRHTSYLYYLHKLMLFSDPLRFRSHHSHYRAQRHSFHPETNGESPGAL